jgi:hypothetical protein
VDVASILFTLFWQPISSFVLCFFIAFLLPFPKKKLKKLKYIVIISVILASISGGYLIVGTNAPDQTQDEYIVNLFSQRFIYLFVQFVPVILIINIILMYLGNAMHILLFKKHH